MMQRRCLLKKTALGLGLDSLMHTNGRQVQATTPAVSDSMLPRLPREVWPACISCDGIEASDPDDMITKMMVRMEEVLPYKPDIICLPENFPCQCASKPSLAEISEVPLGPVTNRFAEFARKYHTNVICATRTVEKGRYYNSAVVIDRQGKVVGEYRKTHLTGGEMRSGLTPGPIDPPVFDLDFGRIGIQICFDIEYLDGWQRLNQKGAEMVFWPSAFAGGRKLNMLAQLFRYVVVSSTRRNVNKICDIDGTVAAKTGIWNPYLCCGPVNLEKAFMHTWPFCKRFKEIKAKYGRKIKITTFHEEEWSIIESRSADAKISQVLKEYELKTFDEFMKEAELMQKKLRS
ncbi:MAG: carbon-nitrogen hydrolase family protein [Planctomycetes bacterium]|nr:carbon-nitrogen hydrolase family protein [Planctomycetota bacterium]